MTGTLLLTVALALAIHLVRRNARLLRGVWGQARWYERAALLLALAPIPGPVDELLGILVIRRVLARRPGR